MQSAKNTSAPSLAPSASMRSPLPPTLTVFIATKSPLTTTKMTAPCGRFAAGVSLSTMHTISAPLPTSPALRSTALSLLGTPTPPTTAPFHFKSIPMTCAAWPRTMMILMTWSCNSSSCVGATTLGGASYYAPRLYFSFSSDCPLLHHFHYLTIALTTLCLSLS